MAEKTLIEALAKAQAEMESPTKDKFNKQFVSREQPQGSPYSSLGAIIAAVKPALNKHGIVFVQKSLAAEGGAAIETVFYGHGEKIETGPVTIPATKITAHGYGGAMTYARRYSLAMACGVDADEDDDGNVATSSVGENASPPKTKPKPIQHEGGVEDYSTKIGAEAFLKGWIEEVLPMHDDLAGVFANNRDPITTIKEHQPEIYEKIKQAYNSRKAEIEAAKENNDAEL
tara:strand:- start:498 stop:1187 length:690 start_codon:yes stop_codon:yes gene_type:complete